MSSKRRLLMATMFALLLTVFVTTSAFAHICTNANKKDGAGSIGTYNIADGTFTPNKPLNANASNGGFVTFTDGVNSFDLYLHQLLPEGALAAGPGGDDQCDGLGVDNFLACIGAAP
jgi:hypothetical protein